MRKPTTIVLALWLCAAVCWAAGAPVAMRVEIVPIEIQSDGTTVEVVIQVSPEDRTRIGINAMVRIELDGEAAPGQSPLYAVRLETDGSTRIETTWPPGGHTLTVGIESADRQSTGIWVGEVRIPGAASGENASDTPPTPVETPSETESPSDAREPSQETTEPVLAAAPAAAAAAAAAAEDQMKAAASDELQVATVPPPATQEPVAEKPEIDVQTGEQDQPVAEAAVAAAVVASAEPERSEPSPPRPVEPAEVSESVEGTETPDDQGAPVPETGVAVGAAAVAAAATAPEMPMEPEVTPEPEKPQDPPAATPETVPVAAAAAAGAVAVTDIGAPPAPEPTPLPEEVSETTVESPETAVEDVVVQPLRAEPAEAPPAAPEPDSVALSTVVEGAYDDWIESGDGLSEITVVVSRDRQPIDGLGPSDLQLRIGKAEVQVADLGDRSVAPLNLGLAFDLSPQTSSTWMFGSRALAPIVERASQGRGQVFAATYGRQGEWQKRTLDFEDVLAAPGEGELGDLISRSLARFDGVAGRSILVLVTDGRSPSDKKGWSEAAALSSQAGVPVLVIALWDDRFSSKLRKQLSQLALASGGSMFLAQGADQIGTAVDRFGPLIDASMALRFDAPANERATDLKLSSGDRSIVISAPEKFRAR